MKASQVIKTLSTALAFGLIGLSASTVANAEKKAQKVYIDENVFPEGIVAAPNGDKYVGGLENGKIYRIGKKTNKATAFAASSKLRNVVGLEVDPQNRRLFVCDVDKTTAKNPQVIVFSLRSQKQIASYQLGESGFCNDLTFDNKGNLFITDSLQKAIFKVAKKDLKTSQTLKPWYEGKQWPVKEGAFGGFTANGIEYINGNLYVAMYNIGDLWEISTTNKQQARKIKLSRSLSAPDGLELDKKGNLLVVEGGSGKLSTISLQKSTFGKVTTILENLDSPTTVALDQGKLWLPISQFDHLFGFNKADHDPKFFVNVYKLNP